VLLYVCLRALKTVFGRALASDEDQATARARSALELLIHWAHSSCHADADASMQSGTPESSELSRVTDIGLR
jgi:hypothetical protein